MADKKYTDALDNILDRPIAFNPSFKKITGSTNAGLLLSQGFYWSKRTKDPEGWFWKTRAEWMDETGLTEDELDGARAKCRESGVMEEKLKGVPATLYYRVNKAKVYELLGVQIPEKSDTEIPEIPESGIPGNSQIPEKQESDEPGNINKESETTPEITPLGGGSGLSKTDLEKANRLMDAILANAQKATYPNRERIPESFLPYCDFYVEMVGKDPDGHYIQVPTQRVITDWILTFEEWKQERLTREHIRAAWEHANRDGGFPVGRPGALTKTAVAMKTKMLASPSAAPALNTAALEHTQKVIQEKTSGTFVPRPANLQKPALVTQSVKSLAERKGIRR
jgi:hypothetical protein